MTREEAIDVLKAYLMFDKSSQQVAEALDMAIEALSADAVSRESYIKAVGYVKWLEKLIVDSETFEWLCEDTTDEEWCEKNCKYDSIQAECLRHLCGINKAVSAEAVSVVRCKDCKHWQKTNIETIDGEPIYDCPFCGEWADANGFCSFGERREPDECE